MGTLAAVVAGGVILGIALVAWLGHREGGGLGWLASRPTMRQIRLLRRGRRVPGRFLYARLLERRRGKRLPLGRGPSMHAAPALSMDDILELEGEWRARGDPGGDCWGYLPYDPRDFSRLLEAAIPVAPKPTFLEAGCGIGTKCLIAALHGLEAHGIEIVPELAARARELGVTVSEEDVREFARYGDYGIVWINRPLKDMEAEDAFEARVREAMAPGAVLIVANTWAHPLNWIPVRDERAAWRGAWQKPHPDRPDSAVRICAAEPVLDQLIAAGVIGHSFASD